MEVAFEFRWVYGSVRPKKMTILHFNDVYNVEGRVKDRATDELFLFFFCFLGGLLGDVQTSR